MKEKNNLALEVNQKPSIGKWIIFAIQHIFAMFSSTILVPILVNSGAGEEVLTIPVALVSSGLGTLIYILCTKGKSPVYLGSSFAFIVPLIAAYIKGGVAGAMTGVMVVGIICVICAIIVKIIGNNWINKLLPPIVIGLMIMIIGLGLAPTAVRQIGLQEGIVIQWQQIVVALVSFLTTTIIAISAKGFLKLIPFLLGILSGYLTAITLGIVDFTPVAEAAIIGIPNFVFPFVHYTPNFSAALTIAPIALVTIADHIGSHAVLSTTINKDLLKKPGLNRTLLGGGFSIFVAGLIGGPGNTPYGENISVIGLSKIASIWVIWLAAIIAIALGFFSKFIALASTIPDAVLGGVSLLLYGFIITNGLKVLIQNNVDFNNIKNVIIASVMLIFGLGGAAISITSGDLSVTISGMSLAAIVGIILNLCLPNIKEEKTEKETENNVGGAAYSDPQKNETKKTPAKKQTTKKTTTKKATTESEPKKTTTTSKTATKKTTGTKTTKKTTTGKTTKKDKENV